MSEVEITKMSSRGQVVIPQGIREQLDLKTGETFAVAGQGDTLVLKKVKTPSLRELMGKFEDLTAKGNKRAKALKIKQSDVPKIIHKRRGIPDENSN